MHFAYCICCITVVFLLQYKLIRLSGQKKRICSRIAPIFQHSAVGFVFLRVTFSIVPSGRLIYVFDIVLWKFARIAARYSSLKIICSSFSSSVSSNSFALRASSLSRSTFSLSITFKKGAAQMPRRNLSLPNLFVKFNNLFLCGDSGIGGGTAVFKRRFCHCGQSRLILFL